MKTKLNHTPAICLLLLPVLWVSSIRAQSDDFNDGNDTAPPPGWQRYNPIGVGSYSFPDGNKYRLQTAPSPDPAQYGMGRAGSVRTGILTNFYLSVDIVSWDDGLHQLAGVLARITTPGPGQTKGYMFTHDRGIGGTSEGDVDIVRLDNEAATVLANTSGKDGIHFDPTKAYRMVFIGIGSNFIGQVFELPNTTTPVVSVTASDSTYSSGVSGIVVVDDSSPTYQGSCDVTFDNFVSALGAPTMIDDFKDGNDTFPLPAWERYNPIGTGSFSNSFQGYWIRTAPSPDPASYGQGRAGSIRPGNLSDFYVAVDVVDWVDTHHQVMGVMARLSNIGPGTTSGYMFTHDRGNPASTNSGDMDLVRLDNEAATVLSNITGKDGIYFDPTKDYRIEFIGVGTSLTGRVYELPEVSIPVLEITAEDGIYASGATGLLVANNREPFYDGGGDATFDNFRTFTAEPRLTFSGTGSSLTLSWPKIIPLVLESATSLNPANWGTVTEGITVEAGRCSYPVNTGTGPRWFRLAHP